MSRFVMPRQGVRGQNLSPHDGAKLYFKVIGELIGGTDKAVYTDEALSIAATNPVVADSTGLFEGLWLNGDYDVYLRDKDDILLWGPETIRSLVAETNDDTPKYYLTMAAAVSDVSNLVVGGIFYVAERSTGSGGGAWWKAIDATISPGNSPNEIDIVSAGSSIAFQHIDNRISLPSFGASVSPSDSTSIISRAESLNKDIIVEDGEYLTTLSTLDGNYSGFGRIVTSTQTLYDGRASQAETGVAISNDAESRLISRGIKGALKSSIMFSDDVYTVYQHRGADIWLESLLTNSGTVSGGSENTPWKVTQQKLLKSSGWQTVKDATTAGTWSTFNSGDPAVYPGHSVLQASHSAAQRRTITWTAVFGGDIYLMFTGDTDGGQCTVSIDRTATNITAATLANPCVVTSTSHGLSTGNQTRIDEVVDAGGNDLEAALNGKAHTVTVVDADNFSLDGVDTTGLSAWSSGGESLRIDAVVDQYNVSAASHREESLITRGLDSESHTVVVETLITANASSTGTQLNTTSIRIEKGSVAPYSDLFQAKPWIAGNVSRAYEEVQGPTGRFYYTVAGGTNGSTAPVHISGTVSDGTVDWVFMANTSFSQQETIFQVSGSEMEYAYEIDYASGGAQDIGGNLHGGEFNNSLTVLLDQEAETLTEGVTYIAELITIHQNITDFYDPYATKTDVATVDQFHEFDCKSMRVRYDVDWLVSANVGYFYSAMWPILVYNGPATYKVFEKMFTPRRSLVFNDYTGVSSGLIGNAKDSFMQADGRLFVTRGSGGAPTSDNGTIGFSVALKADMVGIDYYNNSNESNAALAMNLNSGSYTGFSSWLGKMYFQYAATGQGLAVTSSDKFSHTATYYTVVSQNDGDLSSL